MCKSFYIFILGLMLCGRIDAQPKTNMEIFYGLIDKSVTELLKGNVTKDNNIYIEFSSPENYEILKSSLIEKAGAYTHITQQKEKSDYVLSYSVEDAKVKYSDAFTQSFLGRNYVERDFSLKGFTGLNKINGAVAGRHFEYSEKDTVELSGLKDLGNQAHPFANPDIPSETFFSSIIGPVAAIGAAITTIYLLFTVRSK